MAARKSKVAPTHIRSISAAVAAGGLNISQELFCRYYTQNGHLFGNATHAYAEAYDYRLHELSSDDAVWGTRQNKDGEDETYLVRPSSRTRAESTCAVEGSRLLRNPKILARVVELLNELLSEQVVDAELYKVIIQNDDLSSKVRAISEFNKLRQRITDKVDLTSGGKTLTDLFAQLDNDGDKQPRGSAPEVQG